MATTISMTEARVRLASDRIAETLDRINDKLYKGVEDDVWLRRQLGHVGNQASVILAWLRDMEEGNG